MSSRRRIPKRYSPVGFFVLIFYMIVAGVHKKFTVPDTINGV